MHLNAADFHILLARQGPSLGLWRAAEIAVLRRHAYRRPVVDLGCGDGLVTSLVLPHVELGLDPEGGALARARSLRCYRRLVPVPIEQFTIRPRSVGTVLSNSVLEHVRHLEPVLGAATRMLRPGGHLVFTAPTEAFSEALVLPVRRYAAWRNQRLQHLNLLPLARWRACLDRAGFSVEQVHPYLRPSLVRAWDALELLQQPRLAGRGLFGLLWRRLPDAALRSLARRAARLDLSAPPPGGGRLIVARKRG